jgi:preprotein translocase subunit Sss1
MKTGMADQIIKKVKDFESLIENGYVLDVHGRWIPLNERVKKERSFIKHLECGEVLVSGKWMSISEACKKQNIDEKLQHTESSYDETQTTSFEQEEDFPPETIMIAAEELQESKPLQQESVQKTDNQPSDDTQQEDVITQETIAMSLHALSEIAAYHQKPVSDDSDSTGYTILKTEKKSWKNYGKILLRAAIVALIIGMAVYSAFRFFPGLFQ